MTISWTPCLLYIQLGAILTSSINETVDTERILDYVLCKSDFSQNPLMDIKFLVNVNIACILRILLVLTEALI